MSAPVENLVQRLNARRSGQGWRAKCPAHDDHVPSLSINEGADGRGLLKCFAGCPTESVLAAAGLMMRDLFPEQREPFTPEAVPAIAALKVQPRPLGQLLAEVCNTLRRYVCFSFPEQPIVIALWAAATWVLEAFDYTAYLHVYSAEKRSGKSRLLDVLALLVKDPWRAVGPSLPVLFRRVERDKPTLLYDEIDTVYGGAKTDGTEEIRSFLCAGFERGSMFSRCVGKGTEQDIKDFDPFCPKALSGIGRCLPDTVTDRCIPIELQRQSREQRVERFRKREAQAVTGGIRAELQAWAQLPGLIDRLRDARPMLPDELNDRLMDTAEPLIGIADEAGGGWPEKARAALVKLCGQEEDQSKGVQLLTAIKGIFNEKKADKLPTLDLLHALVANDEGPWPLMFEDSLKHGKESSAAARLAKMLKNY